MHSETPVGWLVVLSHRGTVVQVPGEVVGDDRIGELLTAQQRRLVAGVCLHRQPRHLCGVEVVAYGPSFEEVETVAAVAVADGGLWPRILAEVVRRVEPELDVVADDPGDRRQHRIRWCCDSRRRGGVVTRRSRSIVGRKREWSRRPSDRRGCPTRR